MMRTKFLAMILAAGGLLSCGGGDGGGGPKDELIIAKASTSGDLQAGIVGLELPTPLCAVVTLGGSVHGGSSVSWAANSGGSLSIPTTVTNASGVACTAWTLGATTGQQAVTATLTGATGSPLTYHATATVGPATDMLLVDGDAQTGDINTTLSQPLTVKVTDAFGNAIFNQSVSWAVTHGSATVTNASVKTNTSGFSSTTVQLGATPGPITVTASVPGLNGDPVTFSLTSVTPPPPPTTIAITVGNIFYRSNRNNTQNPAVDTLAAGGAVTWTWGSLGSHSIESTGNPSFTSSATFSAVNSSYQVVFNTPGTYTYDCGVHGALMTGRIVVK